MAKLGDKTFSNPLFNGPISNYISKLFQDFSVNPLPDTVTIPNEHWKPFIQTLYKGNKQEDPIFLIDDTLIPNYKEIELDNNKFILAFSGGKDSTANLLYLIDEGYDVTCVFTKGINRSATEEIDHAEMIANHVKADLVIDEISISGKTGFFENPVKNVFIISRLIEYGYQHNCANISIGETHNSLTEEMDILYNFSDGTDFLKQFEYAVQSHYPQFKLDWIFEEESTDFCYIMHHHPDVVPMIYSCLMPSRYKNLQLKHTERFHLHADITKPKEVGSMQGRCMNCYKCMMEWAFLAVWGLLPMNKSYLTDKVIPTTINKMGQLYKNMEGRDYYTVHDILDALIDIDLLKEYMADPSKIARDSYHKYPEFNRKRS